MIAILTLALAAATPAPDPCTVGFDTFIDGAGMEQSCPALTAEQRARLERAEANVSKAYAIDVCQETDDPLACMEEGEPL